MGLSCSGAICGLGWDWDWDGLDLCAGLLYEHRFAMLKKREKGDIYCNGTIRQSENIITASLEAALMQTLRCKIIQNYRKIFFRILTS